MKRKPDDHRSAYGTALHNARSPRADSEALSSVPQGNGKGREE